MQTYHLADIGSRRGYSQRMATPFTLICRQSSKKTSFWDRVAKREHSAARLGSSINFASIHAGGSSALAWCLTVGISTSFTTSCLCTSFPQIWSSRSFCRPDCQVWQSASCSCFLRSRVRPAITDQSCPNFRTPPGQLSFSEATEIETHRYRLRSEISQVTENLSCRQSVRFRDRICLLRRPIQSLGGHLGLSSIIEFKIRVHCLKSKELVVKISKDLWW